jgi:DNA polymerase III gamma/tau subunit
VSAAEVAQMLGSLGGDLVWPLLERIVAGDGKGMIEEAQRIASRSVAMDTVLDDLAGRAATAWPSRKRAPAAARTTPMWHA